MWTSWFLRVFSVLGMGTQVVMLRKMIKDTLQFLVLMAGCAAAFAAALYTLFRSTALDGGEECGPLEDLSQSLPVALYRLLLISLDPGSSIECAGAVAETLEAGTVYDFRVAAPFIMSVYVVLSVVLMGMKQVETHLVLLLVFVMDVTQNREHTNTKHRIASVLKIAQACIRRNHTPHQEQYQHVLHRST